MQNKPRQIKCSICGLIGVNSATHGVDGHHIVIKKGKGKGKAKAKAKAKARASVVSDDETYDFRCDEAKRADREENGNSDEDDDFLN